MHSRAARWLLIPLLVFPAPALGGEADDAARPDEDVEGRAKWFAERRRSPTGENPAQLRLRSLQQLRANQASGLLPAGDGGDAWVPLGPSPLFDGGSAFTGRITAFAPHPADAQVLWVGTANGGVWLTTDRGATWTPRTDLEDTLSIGALALDRTNPQTIWVGTGESNASFCPIYGGAGLLKSTDGGATWTKLGESTFAGSGISAVVLHPTTAQTLWVANRLGQRGTNICQDAAGPFGVWRSLDGGATWSLRLGTAQTAFDGSVSDLQISPADPNLLLAGVPKSGVWRSTNGGTSWARVSTGLPTVNTMGRVEVAFDPVVPTTVYVSMENPSGGHLGIWKSTNSGSSFSTLPKPGAGSCHHWPISDLCTYTEFNFGQCFFYHDIAVAADRAVWVAGLGVVRSGDGGATWSHVCKPNVHVDNHALAFAADGRVWLGNDGGVMSTADDGASWTPHNAGLNVAQFYPGPSAHPSNPDLALGGTQDNGALKFSGGPAWTMVDGGDRWRTAISSADPDNTWYSEAASLHIFKTTNAGGVWTLSRNGMPTSESGSSDAPFAQCPDDANVFIGVSDNVWRTNDAMGLWTSNSPDPLDGAFKAGSAATFLTKGHGCQTYFVGFWSGGLWRTTSGGASWTKIATLPGIVADLRSDPADPATLWVTVQGFGVTHVWRSTNALDATPTFTPRDSGLPDTPVNAIALDRKRPGVVWLGTDLGIFRSPDHGATWAPHTVGHPRAIVMGFAEGQETKEILSFTHGRGAFRLVANCGGACPPVANSLVASKDATSALFSWSAVACASFQRYLVYRASDFSAPFPSGWTEISAGAALEHAEPLASAYVAFRVVTENGCGERSD
jgi:photosystem II stability/assembly factor-like uncharacterized protein